MHTHRINSNFEGGGGSQKEFVTEQVKYMQWVKCHEITHTLNENMCSVAKTTKT